MKWQIKYALEYLRETLRQASINHIQDEAIKVEMHDQPDVVAVISASETINAELVTQYSDAYPDMDFLCGYRKTCVWEGEAINFLETNSIGWGSAGTLSSALLSGEVNSAEHKEYTFSYRLIRQMNSIASIDREYDRVFTMTLNSGRIYRVGMLLEYELTADSIRTFWDRFGPIDFAWSINPNGGPTENSVEAGRSLGCEVGKWDRLKKLMQKG